MAHDESGAGPVGAVGTPDAGATTETTATVTGAVGGSGGANSNATTSTTTTTTGSAAVATAHRARNRIQVSREKRPLYFFIGLAKKFLVSEDEVELSGLGLAVTSVVTIAEILKNTGHITISRIATSLVEMSGDGRGSPMPKAKIQIWIRKAEKKTGAPKSSGKKDAVKTGSDGAQDAGSGAKSEAVNGSGVNGS